MCDSLTYQSPRETSVIHNVLWSTVKYRCFLAERETIICLLILGREIMVTRGREMIFDTLTQIDTSPTSQPLS